MVIFRIPKVALLFLYYRCFFILGFLPALGIFRSLYNPNSVQQARRFVTFLEKSGPTFIKLGQLLSTRVDLFSEVYIKELRSLKDRIKPIKRDLLKEVFCREFDCELTDIFSSINPIPVGSASVAQVYKAVLKSGEPVAVKIIKPNIEKIFSQDIRILNWLFTLSSGFSKTARRMRPKKMIHTLKEMVKFEVNLSYEAAAMDKFSHNFAENPNIYTPKIYWDYVSSKVIVEEWIEAVTITDIEALAQLNISSKELAYNLLETFFQQVLLFGFFHADTHSGNLLVNKQGQLVFIDFGIISTIDETTRNYLTELFRSFTNHDYKKAAELHFQMGIIHRKSNIEFFSLACRAIMEKISYKPQSEVIIGEVVEQLIKVTKEFDMEVQENLLLLQKNMIYVENIARILDPQTNIWQTSKEILNKKSYDRNDNFFSHLKNKREYLQNMLLDTKEQYFILKNKSVKAQNRVYKAILWLGVIMLLCNIYILYKVIF